MLMLLGTLSLLSSIQYIYTSLDKIKVAPAQFMGDIESVSNVLNGCTEPELLYMSYNQRVLLLSSDIELNPGPSNDTKQILDAIKKSNDRIEKVRDEVLAVRSDIGELKNQMSGIKSKVEAIETKQNSLEARLTQLETHNETLSYKMEVNTLDLEQLAFNYEKKCEDFDKLEKTHSFS